MFAPGPGQDPSPANQVHDFNPDITPSGLFWTTAIPLDSVEIDLDNATASMQVSNLPILDFFDVINALFGGGPAPIPATVSFDVRWSGVTGRVKVRDEANDFTARLIRDRATIAWSGRAGNFEYVSDPAATSNSVVAEIGKERNGVFFAQPNGD